MFVRYPATSKNVQKRSLASADTKQCLKSEGKTTQQSGTNLANHTAAGADIIHIFKRFRSRMAGCSKPSCAREHVDRCRAVLTFGRNSRPTIHGDIAGVKFFGAGSPWQYPRVPGAGVVGLQTRREEWTAARISSPSKLKNRRIFACNSRPAAVIVLGTVCRSSTERRQPQ